MVILIIAGGVIIIVTRKKLRQHEVLNQSIIDKNYAAEKELDGKVKHLDELNVIIEQKKQTAKALDETLIHRQETARQAAEAYEKTNIDLAQEHIDKAIENLRLKYQQAEQEALEEYEGILNDSQQIYRKRISTFEQELQEIKEQIKDYQAKVDAAVDAHRRAQLDAEQRNFYRLQLPKEDIEEIAKLREIIPLLRNPEPLNKVIYKVYYEKPYTSLVGRVVGAGRHTGIYKITNIENGMCYVGQAVDIAERWKTHVRRGVGAEDPGRNKLYPAMLAFGVENFTFEIIEECSPLQLNEREQYWQNYFKAKEYGYSIR